MIFFRLSDPAFEEMLHGFARLVWGFSISIVLSVVLLPICSDEGRSVSFRLGRLTLLVEVMSLSGGNRMPGKASSDPCQVNHSPRSSLINLSVLVLSS